MAYRIYIKSSTGTFYYLTSDKENPETDEKIDHDEIQFLSNLNPTHAHTFSTEEIVKNEINSLPYPYKEKALYIKTASKSSPIVEQTYYRIIKYRMALKVAIWANSDKSFIFNISENTATFSSLEDAEEFQKSLLGWDKVLSRIVCVYDYGLPNYDFDYEILKTGQVIEVRK